MSTDLDLVARCRGKMEYFRIKELKDVLTLLGLSKQGKKQDLVDRVLTLLSDDHGPNSRPIWGRRNFLGKEGVAKIIEDTFRKMQAPVVASLTSKTHTGSDFNHEKHKEKNVDSYQLEMKVRCSCGSSLISDKMIQCEDPRCGLWQHIGCVITLEKPMDGVSSELPSHFYCEICRINRADPFWVTIGQPLLPLKLTSSGISGDSANTVQTLERTFNLSRADRELSQKTEYDIQVWCLLLNDKVPFRMQWPQYAELQINGIVVRVVIRPGSQQLGINGRDDGPLITTFSREGPNTITLTRCDARLFCFGVRLAKRRTLQQVLGMIPKEGEGELFDDALARVRRCGGGAAMENADSDSDIEVVSDSVTVNLCCPMSGSRIKIAGRFKPCVHMGCFDLETFVELNQRSRKWQCPICLKNYSLENVIIDPYFNRITSLLQNCGEDVTEIDVKPDGSWRAKNENEYKDLANWHLPDGTLCGATDIEVKPDLEKSSHIKEDASEGHIGLRIGIKRNRDGIWEVSNPDNIRLHSSGRPAISKYENNSPVAPMSSSASRSCKDKEDVNVNQEDREQLDLPLHNDHEFDSFSQNKEPRQSVDDRCPTASSKNPDVIVLSDSDDDIVTMVSSRTACDNSCPVDASGIPSCNQTRFTEKYSEDLGQGTNASSSLGLFSNTCDDFGIPIWATQTLTDPGFQLFGNEENVIFEGFNLVANDVADAANVEDLSSCQLNTEMNETLVDNPLAFSSNDPSLQIFLPTRHEEVSLQAEAPTTASSDDWISLRLAGGGSHEEAASHAGDQGFNQFTCKENGIEHFNEAALLLNVKDNKKDGESSSNQGSNNLFSHPCQPRSVKPVFLSIDTDSD